jgi:hypothetical protein
MILSTRAQGTENLREGGLDFYDFKKSLAEARYLPSSVTTLEHCGEQGAEKQHMIEAGPDVPDPIYS